MTEAETPTEKVDEIEVEVESPKPIGKENGKSIYNIKTAYQIKATEYLTLDSFVKDIADCFADDSEYRSYQNDETAELTLANSVLHYVNYFEKEITVEGMTEDFDAWQQVAHDIVNVHGTPVDWKHEELVKEFEKKMNEINSKM